jgi:hypothetical protein
LEQFKRAAFNPVMTELSSFSHCGPLLELCPGTNIDTAGGTHEILDHEVVDRGCDSLIEVIEILKLGYVILHGYDILADFLRGFIQLCLSPSRSENERSFGNETLGGGEPDSAVTSSDHSNLTFGTPASFYSFLSLTVSERDSCSCPMRFFSAFL